jgi:hypothetical protein
MSIFFPGGGANSDTEHRTVVSIAKIRKILCVIKWAKQKFDMET